MTCQQDLHITQGKTFIRVIRWETEPSLYVAITAITQAAPVEITAPGHGIPEGWNVAVVSVRGMNQINAAHNPPRTREFHRAYVTGGNTVEFADVNAADFSPYTSGGYLTFFTPVDLTGYTARMQIKDRAGGTVLDTFTDADAIVIDPTGHTITLTIDATETASYSWVRGVYDLEMVSPGGVVTAILHGAISVGKEITTTP